MPNPTGHRDSIKNSQFKAAWHSGPTRTIRVPIALAEITLEYARQLDQGAEPRDTREVSDNELSTAIAEPRDTQIKVDSQTNNPVDTVAIEPRDTANIQAELEDARADYAKLLESSTHVTNKLRQEVQELRSQLEAQKTSWDELREELENSETIRGEVQAELTAVRSELSDLKQKSATASKDLPEAADILKDLRKALGKKSTASLADVEKILEIIEEDGIDIHPDLKVRGFPNLTI